jgi:carbon monoxide dehydrogenase subunit G
MKITNEFTVHTPIERAWQVLTDLEGIAPCMPGAQLTGVDGDTYKGKVKVKVGPVISEFAGTARFAEKDESGHRAVIDAKGRDARAGGNASALVTAVLTAAGESTQVSVDTDLKISGKLAQFGSGMIKEVSGKLLAQFVSNLEAKLATDETEPDEAKPSEAAPSAAAADQVAPSAAAADQAASSAAVPDQVAPISASSGQAAPNGKGAEEAASDRPASEPAMSEQNPAEQIAPAGEAVPAPVRAARPVATEEPEPLDLLSVAGSSIYKRAIPVVIGVVVVGAIIAWAVARR